MKADPVTHPVVETLQAFALGKLDDNAAQAMLSHLEICPDCRKIFASLNSDSLRASPGVSDTQAPIQSSCATEACASAGIAASPGIASIPPELANHPQYEILRELGRGGMGVVYLARSRLMERLEVLKVINPTLVDHADTLERFLREIRSAAKLNHENVVKAHTVLQLGQLLVFVMEYVEGEDLAKVVKTRGPLGVVHACYYAYQVANGLQHAFEEGMVHRDIKPQNLILTRKGKKQIIKILDFGLAKATSEKRTEKELTGTGMMLGTPDYMAPEQMMDAAKASIHADIYSLGCTLYYLLSGCAPFQATNLYQLLYAHQSAEAKLLHQVRSEVPAKLGLIVAKMMAKDPCQRFQTPAEVAQALRPFFEADTRTEAIPGPQPRAENVVAPEAATSRTADLPPSKLTASTKRKRRLVWMWPPVVAGVLLAGFLAVWATTDIKHKPAVQTEEDGRKVAVESPTTPAGVIVLEDLPDGPEVRLDGEEVYPIWNLKLKNASLGVRPGKYKLQVRKHGFNTFSEEVAIADSERKVVKVKLTPVTETAPPAAAAEGRAYVSLFNGRNLLGWKVHPSARGAWKVENGAITCTGSASHLFTSRGDYENFHFLAEAKINLRGNSGLYFRAQYGGPGFPQGYEAQINCGHSDPIRTGSLYPAPWAFPKLSAADKEKLIVRKAPHKPGDWFLLEVIADGNHFVIKVNGTTTVDFVDRDNTYRKGHFALQHHDASTKVWFRKLEVKELKATKPQ
jgi:serine/threonine protein kinase